LSLSFGPRFTSGARLLAGSAALIRQQNELPHGMFLPWIETEFEMGKRTANRFMIVPEHFTGKLATVARLSTRALYELAAPSTPPEVQTEVERRIAAGELLSGEKAHNAEAAALGRHGHIFSSFRCFRSSTYNLICEPDEVATSVRAPGFRSTFAPDPTSTAPPSADH
jgi:hypothetical protein